MTGGVGGETGHMGKKGEEEERKKEEEEEKKKKNPLTGLDSGVTSAQVALRTNVLLGPNYE